MRTKRFRPAQTCSKSKRVALPDEQRKEILVPVDFSTSSLMALRHAAALAQKENAELTLLNVIEEPVSFRSLDRPFRERSRLESQASDLEALADRELPPEVAAHIVVCEGDPATEITRTAAQRQTEMIVVGRHHHHWLIRPFCGNTAVRVMEKASCPVVVLNETQSRPARPAARNLPEEPWTPVLIMGGLRPEEDSARPAARAAA